MAVFRMKYHLQMLNGDSMSLFFREQCKFCGRDGTVTMIPGKGKPLTQELSEGGKYAPLMLFDFRGYEPEGFVFSGAWTAESVSFFS
jgi:hypothetical protein